MRLSYDVACPKCGAVAGADCVSLTRGRTTDTHVSRVDAAVAARAARRVAVLRLVCPHGHGRVPDGSRCHVCGAEPVEAASSG